ncbi:MAG: FAD-dependent oxidoreductase, partial [Candidatus Jordarchaeaceae archaeon]
MKSFELLFSPIQIRNVTLPNRIALASHTTKLGSPEGYVTDKMIHYYSERAKGGTGLITVELTAVEKRGRHRTRALCLYDDSFIPGLKKLCSEIKKYGSKLAIQLAHGGMECTSRSTGGIQPIAPSYIKLPVYDDGIFEIVEAKEATKKDIEEIELNFLKAARRSKEAGFDMIEIHGAHAYLIGQFLSPLFNKRTDEYGGDVKNRSRLAVEIIEMIKNEIKDLPVIFRISGDEFTEGGLTIKDTIKICKFIEDAGADVIHVSAGVTYAPLYTVQPMNFPEGVLIPLAAAIKKEVSIPVMAVGRIHDPFLAENTLREGKADIIAMTRQLIADPEWPRKVREGRLSEIRKCLSCNTCIDRMRMGLGVQCAINPAAGREEEFLDEVTKSPKKVMVIGGGPAGMQAAIILAKRGHKVVLYEANRLGGQLCTAARMPVFQNVIAKEEIITTFIEYLKNQVKQSGISIVLKKATLKEIEKENPDLIVVATGAKYKNMLIKYLLIPLLSSNISKRYAHIFLRLKKKFGSNIFHLLRKPNDDIIQDILISRKNFLKVGDCNKLGETVDAVYDA